MIRRLKELYYRIFDLPRSDTVFNAVLVKSNLAIWKDIEERDRMIPIVEAIPCNISVVAYNTIFGAIMDDVYKRKNPRQLLEGKRRKKI